MQALPTPPPTPTPAPPPLWRPTAATSMGIPGVYITAVQGAIQLVASRMLFQPFKVTAPIYLTSALLNVSAANATAGAKVRVGIYKCDSEGQPAGLVADLGELAIDAIAVVTTTFNVYLPVGNYLYILHADANCGGAERIITHRGITECNFITNGSSGQMTYQYYVSRTYGPFDNPGTKWTTTSTSTGPFIYYVTFGWQAA